jgi:uncharacterized protein YbaP (TraB family)
MRARTCRIRRGGAVWLTLALMLGSCTTDRTPMAAAPERLVSDEIARPPFYQIDDRGGATLLLLGTIHLGPAAGWKFSNGLLEALDRADRFILEVDLREATEEAISSLVADVVIIDPPNTLIDLVSPETARLLEEKKSDLTRIGMPENALRRMKPWFIAMGLIESAATASGFSADASAESIILAARGMRPLIGLETIAQQIGMLDGLSPKHQDLMLRDALLRLDSAVEDIRALVSAWRRGDEKQLEETARDGVDDLPELEGFYDILLGERNRQWLSTFRSLLDDPEHAGETIFVGVGALHLVGEDGLVDLLREAGYLVESIDHSGSRAGDRI